jgi:hypothetical protein
MAQCPVCNTPGAYIGFSTIECRNPDCKHYVVFQEEVCPCCGKVGHQPGEAPDALMHIDTVDTSIPGPGTPSHADPSYCPPGYSVEPQGDPS